ncbi:hypothetical protein [uncultured Sphingomonas sp.]
MRRVGDAVLATTFQGAEVLLDMASGAHLTMPELASPTAPASRSTDATG